MDKILNSPPQELLNAIRDVYQAIGMDIASIYREKEGRDYGACRLKLNSREIVFRVAKTTPKKIGQFVTVWQRPLIGGGYIPFSEKDNIDFVVVSVAAHKNIGQFVFDRSILLHHGIIANAKTKGKGGFRVYPPWAMPENKIALQTQQWQNQYFFSQNILDFDLVRNLFKLK